MTSRLELVAVATTAGLLLLVVELIRRRKLTEEYSFIWIFFAAGLLVLSFWRDGLHSIAAWLDVHYPPGVLLGALIVAVFIASLYFSVIVSRQREQIERLVEEMAILSAERCARAGEEGPRPSGDTPGASSASSPPGGRPPSEPSPPDSAGPDAGRIV